jgi:hypothetical protein
MVVYYGYVVADDVAVILLEWATLRCATQCLWLCYGTGQT